MKIRIISGAVGVLLLLPVLFFSGTILLPIVTALLAFLASIELSSAVGLKRRLQFLLPTCVYALLLPMLTHFMREDTQRYVVYAALLTLLYVLVAFCAAVLSNGRVPFSGVAQLVLSVVYATVGFASVSLLRILDGGAYIYGLVFVGAWVTDTMAYFVGRLLGKHKLCPAISPKKTVEGSVGGIFFCVLGFLLYGFIMQKVFALSPNYLMLALAGLLSSIISQIGDLTASLIKREHGVKDFGKIMPGHGGVMDRFDSIIAVAILLVLLCTLPEGIAFFS